LTRFNGTDVTALQAHYNMSSKFEQAITLTNLIVTIIFFVEMVAKWVALRSSAAV